MHTQKKVRLLCDKRTSITSGRRPIGLFLPVYFLYFPIFYNDPVLLLKEKNTPIEFWLKEEKESFGQL